jgi:Antidote-toxin recognition MazE, bacterial antitoxin
MLLKYWSPFLLWEYLQSFLPSVYVKILCYDILDIQYCFSYQALIGTTEYRKVQGIVGEQSFSVVLPKKYALDLGIAKGDFVKVRQDEGKIIIEKA